MFDRLAARHEAAHCVVGAALGLRHVAIVRDDGSGQVNWDGEMVSSLAPEDRAILAVSGNVAECMAIDGNLKRAVQDTLDKDSYDAVMLRLALRELAPEAWKYGRHGPALAAAAKARSIIQENRAEFNRLTAELQENGVGQVRMGPAPATSRPAALGVDNAANLAALRGGQVAGVAELRNLATRAAADGNAKLAKLMEATLARREGREVKQVTEFSIGGPAKVILQGEVV